MYHHEDSKIYPSLSSVEISNMYLEEEKNNERINLFLWPSHGVIFYYFTPRLGNDFEHIIYTSNISISNIFVLSYIALLWKNRTRIVSGQIFLKKKQKNPCNIFVKYVHNECPADKLHNLCDLTRVYVQYTTMKYRDWRLIYNNTIV